ncbi:hypothetical protein BJ170DRAFT_710507 [Xylariales sp. AK1849]|nr:hypothetical protein BJ170DRAFT_710507 [Xylariales sp. AK1849]
MEFAADIAIEGFIPLLCISASIAACKIPKWARQSGRTCAGPSSPMITSQRRNPGSFRRLAELLDTVYRQRTGRTSDQEVSDQRRRLEEIYSQSGSRFDLGRRTARSRATDTRYFTTTRARTSETAAQAGSVNPRNRAQTERRRKADLVLGSQNATPEVPERSDTVASSRSDASSILPLSPISQPEYQHPADIDRSASRLGFHTDDVNVGVESNSQPTNIDLEYDLPVDQSGSGESQEVTEQELLDGDWAPIHQAPEPRDFLTGSLQDERQMNTIPEDEEVVEFETVSGDRVRPVVRLNNFQVGERGVDEAEAESQELQGTGSEDSSAGPSADTYEHNDVATESVEAEAELPVRYADVRSRQGEILLGQVRDWLCLSQGLTPIEVLQRLARSEGMLFYTPHNLNKEGIRSFEEYGDGVLRFSGGQYSRHELFLDDVVSLDWIRLLEEEDRNLSDDEYKEVDLFIDTLTGRKNPSRRRWRRRRRNSRDLEIANWRERYYLTGERPLSPLRLPPLNNRREEREPEISLSEKCHRFQQRSEERQIPSRLGKVYEDFDQLSEDLYLLSQEMARLDAEEVEENINDCLITHDLMMASDAISDFEDNDGSETEDT